MVRVIPKITGFMSIVGSAFIVATVLRSKEKRGRVYHRLLLAMAILDVSTSFWFFMGSWPIPQDTPTVDMSLGTTWSCTLQGFFIQLGLAVPFYNAMLSVNYLLAIRYGWSDQKMHSVEPYMHVGALAWPLASAIACLPMTLFNNANLWCWIAPLPAGCNDDDPDPANHCIRGHNAVLYQWVFFYVELWALMLFCSVAMALVVARVRQQEQAVAKYGSGGGNTGAKKKHAKSQRVAKQALLYVGVFYLTWLFGTINRMYQAITKTTSFPLLVLHSVFVPWQGFLNFLVYNRPYYLRYKDNHPEEGCCHMVIMFFFCCCLYRSEAHHPDGVKTSIYNLGVTKMLRRLTSKSTHRLVKRDTTANTDHGRETLSEFEDQSGGAARSFSEEQTLESERSLEEDLDQRRQDLAQL